MAPAAACPLHKQEGMIFFSRPPPLVLPSPLSLSFCSLCFVWQLPNWSFSPRSEAASSGLDCWRMAADYRWGHDDPFDLPAAGGAEGGIWRAGTGPSASGHWRMRSWEGGGSARWPMTECHMTVAWCQCVKGRPVAQHPQKHLHGCTVAFALIPSSQTNRKHQKERQWFYFQCDFSTAGIVMMFIMVSCVGYIIIYSRWIYQINVSYF